MRLKLIYPSQRTSHRKHNMMSPTKFHRYPGLGLLMVASLCPPDTEIKMVDEEFEDIGYEEETDLVGISLLTANALRAYEIAGHFRDRNIPVVLGGMHVTACPEEASKHADSIVIGEAEDTWDKLLRDFQSGELQKTYRSALDSDLSNMPFPRRDLLHKARYVTVNTVQASRGCSFDCEFCSIPALFGRQPRTRPIAEVIEEVKSLEGNIFVLNDDNLAQRNNYYKELFRRLIPLKKKWVGEASWNITQDD